MRRIRIYRVLCSLLIILSSLQGLGQQNSNTSPPGVRTPAERDGQHDFDPLIGAWKFHLKKLLHPLTGANDWVEFDGTGVCYKIW